MTPPISSTASLSAIDRKHIPDFTSIPWAHTLLESPDYIRIPFTSRDPSYKPRDPRTFACLNTTLATPETIRSFICLQRAPTSSPSSNLPPSPSSPTADTDSPAPGTNELLALISLGTPALDGWPGVLHGGIVALLFDEILGAVAEQVLSIEVMTASMKVDYKKAVPTPGAVLGKANVEKWEGRKAWIVATLEDGEGGVYARGEALFVRPKGRKLGSGEGRGVKL